MGRVGLLGTKYTTVDCLETLLHEGVRIDQVITINEDQAVKNRVAGYVDVAPIARRHGIPVHFAGRYDMKTDEDVEAFAAMGLDVLLVIGWERLVPGAVLERLRLFACGMHGSPDGLPRGRGRSPLNWSLILGKKRFVTSLFVYDEEIDNGKIIDSVPFEITQWDDIESLHLKNRMAMTILVKKHIDGMLAGDVELGAQDLSQDPTYYPKRAPEDGGIDWNRTSLEIYDFVRALTRPYPGAFTWRDDERVTIWRARPLGDIALPQGDVGEVVDVSTLGPFVVRTGDGGLMVTDYSVAHGEGISRADRLRSESWSEQIARIAERYPAFVRDDQKEVK